MGESGELRVRNSTAPSEAAGAPLSAAVGAVPCTAVKDTFHGPFEKYPKQLLIAIGAMESLLLLGTIINLLW